MPRVISPRLESAVFKGRRSGVGRLKVCPWASCAGQPVIPIHPVYVRTGVKLKKKTERCEGTFLGDVQNAGCCWHQVRDSWGGISRRGSCSSCWLLAPTTQRRSCLRSPSDVNRGATWTFHPRERPPRRETRFPPWKNHTLALWVNPPCWRESYLIHWGRKKLNHIKKEVKVNRLFWREHNVRHMRKSTKQKPNS